MRVLIGGLGYRFLRDESIGPYVSDRLAARARNGIEVEDVSYHPVGLAQNLQEREPYDRLVLVSSVRRGRPAGTVEVYRWDGRLPPNDVIQDRVAEAVTGVISLDNTLIVCAALGGLPDDVRVIEVEPGPEAWGEGFGPELSARLKEIEELAWSSAQP